MNKSIDLSNFLKLVFMLFFLFSGGAFANPLYSVETVGNSFRITGDSLQSGELNLISPGGEILRLDTVYSYGYAHNYNDSTISEEYLRSRLIYVYDCRLNNVLQITDVPAGGGQWAPSETIEKKFDSENRLLSQAEKRWNYDSAIWILSYHLENIFDSLGNRMEYNRIFYDAETGGLVRQLNYTYFYNPDGTKSEEIFEHRFYINNTLEKRQTLFFYNLDMLPESSYENSWDTLKNEWIPLNQTNLQYPDSGRIITYLQWDEDSHRWLNYKRSIVVYEDITKPLSLENQVWDAVSETWQSTDLYEYGYDESGNKLTEEGMKWDAISESWQRIYFSEYTFDELGNQLSFYAESLTDSGSMVWASKTDYSYDFENQTMTLNSQYIPDPWHRFQWFNTSKRIERYATGDQLQFVGLPYEGEEICMVSVSVQNHNLLVWEKTPGVGTIFYHIYREGDVANEYRLIGSVPFDSVSIFVDAGSDPRAKAYRYKIKSVNDCGESDFSFYHQSIHLQISQNVNSYNLNWSRYDYEGGELTFVTHEIYRGTEPYNMEKIGSVSGNMFSYTDVNPPRDTLYYQIRGVLNNACDPFGKLKAGAGPYQHSMSNLEDNKLTMGTENPLINSSLEIYPNPVNTRLHIRFHNPAMQEYLLVVTDLSGKVVRTTGHIRTSRVILEREQLEPGLYLFELRGPEIHRGKFIIE